MMTTTTTRQRESQYSAAVLPDTIARVESITTTTTILGALALSFFLSHFFFASEVKTKFKVLFLLNVRFKTLRARAFLKPNILWK